MLSGLDVPEWVPLTSVCLARGVKSDTAMASTNPGGKAMIRALIENAPELGLIGTLVVGAVVAVIVLLTGGRSN